MNLGIKKWDSIKTFSRDEIKQKLKDWPYHRNGEDRYTHEARLLKTAHDTYLAWDIASNHNQRQDSMYQSLGVPLLEQQIKKLTDENTKLKEELAALRQDNPSEEI